MNNTYKPSRRTFLATTAAALASAGLGTHVAAAAPPLVAGPSLKDAYKNDFLIGSALDFRRPD